MSDVNWDNVVAEVQHCHARVQKLKKESVLEIGTAIPWKAVQKIANISSPVAVTNHLFPRTSNKGPAGSHVKWSIELLCKDCGDTHWHKTSKTQFIKQHRTWAKNGKQCSECEKREQRERERRKRERQERTKENTVLYIENYIDPDRYWEEGVSKKQQWKKVSRPKHSPLYNEERIASAIQRLSYDAFMETPYWKAVASYVRYKRDYQCQLCGNRDTFLHVHHSDYSIHGREHLKTDKLLCLCEACHSRHHAKEAS
jgi:5-methylcytosine-specific restriction endonuclease McrA